MEKVTVEMLLELPKLILDRTEKQNKYIRPLSTEYIKENYYKELRNELLSFFNEFHNKKGMAKLDITDKIKWTRSNDTLQVQNYRKSDSVGNIVIASISDNEWIGNVYDCIVNISYKLTKQEGVYFVNTFFESVKEVVIAKQIGIGRTKLQDIKKSCLLKVLSEVEPYMH